MNNTFGSCPSKLDSECFACALDFGHRNNTFYGISASLNIIFAQLPGGKSNDPGKLKFFYISPLKTQNLVLIPGAKLDAWTGCL